jgi:putative salt-induced outer membrane protein
MRSVSKYICGAIVGLLHVGNAFAQDPLEGSIAFGYLATSGNTDSTNANAGFKLLWDRGGLWRHEWNALAVKASTDDVTTAEAYAAGYKAQRDFSESAYLFTSADWRRDEFSGYDEQTTEAVGYGRRLIDNDRHMLAIEGGLGAKQSTLIDGSELDEGIVRGGLQYVLTISENSDFSQKFLTEIGEDNRYTESVSALRARLIGNLAIVLSYTVKNNSDVPPTVEKTDTFTAISLEYGF